MRDFALFLIFILTVLAGFPLMKGLDRFILYRVRGPEDAPFDEAGDHLDSAPLPEKERGGPRP